MFDELIRLFTIIIIIIIIITYNHHYHLHNAIVKIPRGTLGLLFEVINEYVNQQRTKTSLVVRRLMKVQCERNMWEDRPTVLRLCRGG